MPTETAPKTESTPPPDNQGLPAAVPGEELRGNTAEEIQTTSSALDELLKASGATEEGEGDPQPTAEEIAAEEKAAKEAEEKAAKEAAEKAEKEKAAPAPDKTAEEKAKEKPAPVTDEFDKVELPPYTKPKSVEAFATVKQMARERVASLEREKAEIQAKLEAAEKAKAEAPAGLPAEAEKELKELREFRAKFDVEADPSFKTYDSSIKENEGLIIAKMKAAGVDEESIKQIQAIGISQVEWESVLPKLPPTLKRFIEGKLYENDNLSEKKKLAIETAKSNASEFVRTRQEELYKGTEARQQTTMQEFNALLPNMDWLKKETIDPKAPAEAKAKAEATNALIDKVNADLQEAINDDSPRMRAILIGGFAKLMRVQADFEATKAAHKAEVEKLNSTIKEKDEFIARIKKSSTSRLSSAAPGVGESKTKTKVDLNEDGASALDRLHRELVASQS
jgi:colicin import membrane protein